MHNACRGELGNTSSLPIMMINGVFETTPFWALGVYGRMLKALASLCLASLPSATLEMRHIVVQGWGQALENVSRTVPAHEAHQEPQRPCLSSFLTSDKRLSTFPWLRDLRE